MRGDEEQMRQGETHGAVATVFEREIDAGQGDLLAGLDDAELGAACEAGVCFT